MELRFLFSAHRLIMLYICTKLHKNIFDGFKVTEWVRFPYYIGVGRGGARGGQAPPNNFGEGANIPFGPPNNPPAFSFNFYVKQEKITNVPS